jgi:hypothetical protein
MVLACNVLDTFNGSSKVVPYLQHRSPGGIGYVVTVLLHNKQQYVDPKTPESHNGASSSSVLCTPEQGTRLNFELVF